MICLIALIVFGILGIFSASYRQVAKEAFICVFRRATLRKCETGLDVRLKSKIISKIAPKFPRIGKFLYKYFEVFSWFFVVLFFASLAYSAYSGYNFWKYGNCYGPQDNGGFCPLTLLEGERYSRISSQYNGTIVYPSVGNAATIGSPDAPVTIIEFGCFVCSNTKKAEATVQKVLNNYKGKVYYAYRDLPIESHLNAVLSSEVAYCAKAQGKYWEYHNMIFKNQEVLMKLDEESAKEWFISKAGELGLDENNFGECLANHTYLNQIEKDFEDGLSTGVTATPTFFVNNQSIIGCLPYGAFEAAINSELKKAGING